MTRLRTAPLALLFVIVSLVGADLAVVLARRGDHPVPIAAVHPDNPIAAAPVAPPSAPVIPAAATAAPAPATEAVVRRPIDPPADPYVKEPINQIGTVEIPALGLVHPIFEGISLTVIDHGPSHWPGTAMPGQPGNTVFAGHRVTHTHPFRDIDRLVPGDQVIFTIGGQRSVYVVTGHDVVTPSQTEIANQTADATGTLFACHPPHSAKYRYVVHLKLTS